MLKIARVSTDAKLPTREPDSCGYDLYAYGNHILSPGETRVIPVGFHIVLPPGYAALIWDRSSFGSKGIHVFRQLIDVTSGNNQIDDVLKTAVFGGVIDYGYRGQMGTILHNFSTKIFDIKHGDRISQFIIQKCEMFDMAEISMDELLAIPSERGERGFGSSGGVPQAIDEGKSIDEGNWKPKSEEHK